MKKVMIFAAALLCCCACNKTKVFTGDYSYKTSGMVTITTSSDELQHNLSGKIGQLNVIDLKAEDKDSILLIFNEMNGGLNEVRAQVVGDSIYIEPYVKTMTLTIGGESMNYEINVTGSGVRYDNMLKLDESYDGQIIGGDADATIQGEHILTVATRN